MAEWVSDAITKYNAVDKSDMDKVEQTVLLANMLKEKRMNTLSR